MNTGSAEVSAMQRYFWSLRREFWENRWVYLAPLAVAAVFLVGFLVSAVHLPEKMRAASAFDPIEQREAIALPYDIAASLIMATAIFLAAFYCLDALYGERRDRSILFWKSLPVSDLTAVLAKATLPIVIVLIAWVITVATQSIMLLVSSAVLAGSGGSAAALWAELAFPRMSLLLLYHMLTVHLLWSAPIYGWFLLVSAWARRAPFLWAFLPPLAICYLERIAFRTTYLADLLLDRLSGGMEALAASGTFPMDPMTQITPLRLLGAPGLWVGLAVTAAFLLLAARVRRNQGPV